MEKTASEGAGGAVGAGGSAGLEAAALVASRPRMAPAAARVPIILRRVAEVSSGLDGVSDGSMGGIAGGLL